MPPPAFLASPRFARSDSLDPSLSLITYQLTLATMPKCHICLSETYASNLWFVCQTCNGAITCHTCYKQLESNQFRESITDDVYCTLCKDGVLKPYQQAVRFIYSAARRLSEKLSSSNFALDMSDTMCTMTLEIDLLQQLLRALPFNFELDLKKHTYKGLMELLTFITNKSKRSEIVAAIDNMIKLSNTMHCFMCSKTPHILGNCPVIRHGNDYFCQPHYDQLKEAIVKALKATLTESDLRDLLTNEDDNTRILSEDCHLVKAGNIPFPIQLTDTNNEAGSFPYRYDTTIQKMATCMATRIDLKSLPKTVSQNMMDIVLQRMEEDKYTLAAAAQLGELMEVKAPTPQPSSPKRFRDQDYPIYRPTPTYDYRRATPGLGFD